MEWPALTTDIQDHSFWRPNDLHRYLSWQGELSGVLAEIELQPAWTPESLTWEQLEHGMGTHPQGLPHSSRELQPFWVARHGQNRAVLPVRCIQSDLSTSNQCPFDFYYLIFVCWPLPGSLPGHTHLQHSLSLPATTAVAPPPVDSAEPLEHFRRGTVTRCTCHSLPSWYTLHHQHAPAHGLPSLAQGGAQAC